MVILTSTFMFHFGTNVTHLVKCRIPFLEANLQDLKEMMRSLTVCYTVIYFWNKIVNNNLLLKGALAL